MNLIDLAVDLGKLAIIGSVVYAICITAISFGRKREADAALALARAAQEQLRASDLRRIDGVLVYMWADAVTGPDYKVIEHGQMNQLPEPAQVIPARKYIAPSGDVYDFAVRLLKDSVKEYGTGSTPYKIIVANRYTGPGQNTLWKKSKDFLVKNFDIESDGFHGTNCGPHYSTVAELLVDVQRKTPPCPDVIDAVPVHAQHSAHSAHSPGAG